MKMPTAFFAQLSLSESEYSSSSEGWFSNSGPSNSATNTQDLLSSSKDVICV